MNKNYDMILAELKARIGLLKLNTRTQGLKKSIWVENKYKSKYYKTTGLLMFKAAQLIEDKYVEKNYWPNKKYSSVWDKQVVDSEKVRYEDNLEEILEWFINVTEYSDKVAREIMRYNNLFYEFYLTWKGE